MANLAKTANYNLYAVSKKLLKTIPMKMNELIDNQKTTDQQARFEALDFSKSFIVQAPAGSGKTELLTQRYLSLLANACQTPEEILAITFTRKAAAEMRQRVISASTSNQPHTRELAQKVLEKNYLLNWNILQNPQRLKIMTIDALCGYLNSRMPILSGVSIFANVIENPKLLYQKAAQEVILHSSPAALLKYLDNDAPKLIKLCSDLLRKREQWLPYILSSTPGIQLRNRLQQGLKLLAQELIEKTHKMLLTSGVKQSLFNLLKYAGNNLLTTAPEKSLTAWADLSQFPETHYNQLSLWKSLAQALLTEQFEWRKTVNKNHGFPAKTFEKKYFEDILLQLSANTALQSALQEILICPPVHYSDEQWAIILALFELLPTLAAQLRLLFEEQGVMDFIEMGLRASQALGIDQPTDLALALDYRIRHILVDEFQDTSVAQFKLLEKLTQGWQQEDDHTLFLVGDPMQSIYRFRNAEVGLFLRTLDQGIQNIRLQPLQLSQNFRCSTGLVNWYNQIFPHIFPQNGQIAEGAIPYFPATATQKESELAAVNCYGCSNYDYEAQELISVIHKIRNSEPCAQIAILVRARIHLKHILPALQSAEINFQAVELDLLSQHSAIQDLAALTRALHHRADRIAWLAILRAPFCGLILKDLQIITETPYPTILESLLDFEKNTELSEDGKLRLRRIVPVLSKAMANAGRTTISRWVEQTWLALGGPAGLTHTNQLSNVKAFFELLEKTFKAGALFNIQLLNEQLKALYAAPDPNSDARLQVMTIHKAKGLEFDHVIIPQLHRSGATDSQQLLMWTERVNAKDGADLLLAPIKKKAGKDNSLYTYLNYLEQKKLSLEISRLFYVAVTRAKKTVHLLAVLPPKDLNSWPPPSNSFLKLIWSYFRSNILSSCAMFPLKSAEISNGINQLSDQPVFNLRRLVANWQAPNIDNLTTNIDQPAPPFILSIRNKQAAILGTVIHEALARQHLPDPLAIDNEQIIWKRKLRQLGYPEPNIDQAVSIVKQALLNTINDPRGLWIFSPLHKDCRHEYSLTTMLSNQPVQVILDRTFIDASGVRWIIEFKSSEYIADNLQTYQEQLFKYATIFSKKEQNKLRLGLYFPLNSFWKEWEYTSA
ncbi:MAG: UvrD-helicase domain-containing protein [Proteobacteria bacterium]|nr:UvrD-helicase domain-containing protein [Pseudomonadota bacterium]